MPGGDPGGDGRVPGGGSRFLAVSGCVPPRGAVVQVEDPAGCWTLRRARGVVSNASSSTPRRGPVPARLTVVVGSPSSGVGFPLRSNLVAPGRGVLRIGPVGVWLVDPFAVVEAALIPAPAIEGVVVPRPVPAPVGTPLGAALEVAGAGLSGSGGRLGPTVRFGDEVAAVAPIVPGAPPGRVHWPTTFRTGEPMALRFAGEEVRADGVVLWLDTRRSVHDAASLEMAVAVAAAVGLLVLGQRRLLQLVSGIMPVTLRPGPWAAVQFLDQLAVVDTTTPVGLEELEARGASRGSGPVPSVVVTTVAGASTLAGIGTQTTVLMVDSAGGVTVADGSGAHRGGLGPAAVGVEHAADVECPVGVGGSGGAGGIGASLPDPRGAW